MKSIVYNDASFGIKPENVGHVRTSNIPNSNSQNTNINARFKPITHRSQQSKTTLNSNAIIVLEIINTSTEENYEDKAESPEKVIKIIFIFIIQYQIILLQENIKFSIKKEPDYLHNKNTINDIQAMVSIPKIVGKKQSEDNIRHNSFVEIINIDE